MSNQLEPFLTEIAEAIRTQESSTEAIPAADFAQRIQSLSIGNYVLPAATGNRLGGVKIGSNLTISEDGTLSADAQSVEVDLSLNTGSENPVQNKVVAAALEAKADKENAVFYDELFSADTEVGGSGGVLSDGSVTTAKLTDGAVTAEKLELDSVAEAIFNYFVAQGWSTGGSGGAVDATGFTIYADGKALADGAELKLYDTRTVTLTTIAVPSAAAAESKVVTWSMGSGLALSEEGVLSISSFAEGKTATVTGTLPNGVSHSFTVKMTNVIIDFDLAQAEDSQVPATLENQGSMGGSGNVLNLLDYGGIFSFTGEGLRVQSSGGVSSFPGYVELSDFTVPEGRGFQISIKYLHPKLNDLAASNYVFFAPGAGNVLFTVGKSVNVVTYYNDGTSKTYGMISANSTYTNGGSWDSVNAIQITYTHAPDTGSTKAYAYAYSDEFQTLITQNGASFTNSSVFSNVESMYFCGRPTLPTYGAEDVTIAAIQVTLQ